MNLVSALKNRFVIALIIAGAMTIVVPILVCGRVSFLWQSCLSLAASKVFLVAERFESGPKSSARRGKSARQWGALAHVGFEPEAGIADP